VMTCKVRSITWHNGVIYVCLSNSVGVALAHTEFLVVVSVSSKTSLFRVFEKMSSRYLAALKT
jgi:hypothetical protein